MNKDELNLERILMEVYLLGEVYGDNLAPEDLIQYMIHRLEQLIFH